MSDWRRLFRRWHRDRLDASYLDTVARELRTLGGRVDRLAQTLSTPQPTTVGVVLIGEKQSTSTVLQLGERDEPPHRSTLTAASQPFYASWSAQVPPGGSVQWRFRAYHRIVAGAWLIGLNGALLERVMVGDFLQSSEAGPHGCGPIARITTGMDIGYDLVVTVRCVPGGPT